MQILKPAGLGKIIFKLQFLKCSKITLKINVFYALNDLGVPFGEWISYLIIHRSSATYAPIKTWNVKGVSKLGRLTVHCSKKGRKKKVKFPNSPLEKKEVQLNFWTLWNCNCFETPYLCSVNHKSENTTLQQQPKLV